MPARKSAEGHRLFTLNEVAEHTTASSCWIVVHKKVYDVTKFLIEHPGGEDIIIETAGRDASNEFEDAGHSTAARKQLDSLYIGELKDAEADAGGKAGSIKTAVVGGKAGGAKTSSTFLRRLLQIVLPLVVLGVALGISRLNLR